jgi:2-aminoethylphosphonate dioxygenase
MEFIAQQESSILRRLKSLFSSHGSSDYIGEPVSIVEHSFQAGYFASKDTDDQEVILAAFLHDIGHILGLEANMEMRMGNCGIMDHEKIGGDFLRKCGFPERIAYLVQNHVQAKRYLCFKNPEYFNQLSTASVTTLGYQGGPMNESEAISFEQSDDFQVILKLRSFDESAKVADFPKELLATWSTYSPWIDSFLTSTPFSQLQAYILSNVQIQSFQEQSYVRVSNLLQYAQLSPEQIVTWCEEIASWPKVENQWLSHWELNPETNEKIMCRSENFLDYHEGMSMLARQIILPIVSQLFNETAVLFKEKINYKLAGGAGFAAHQDTPAYINLANDHISVMVAIDAANIENGCLQVCPGQWSKGQVALNEVGVILPEEEAQMQFHPVECQAGDILFFSGYIPHRSGPNKSTRSRRAMYLTYNPSSQGEHRTAYYAAKHAKINGFNSSNTISFQGDFQGIVVD